MKIVGVTPVKMNNVRTPGKNTKLLSDSLVEPENIFRFLRTALL